MAFAISAAGIFGVFLFLTYYLQQTLGYSPVRTGLAFLPMVGGADGHREPRQPSCSPRAGPRPLVPAGMLLAAAGMSCSPASAPTPPTRATSCPRCSRSVSAWA